MPRCRPPSPGRPPARQSPDPAAWCHRGSRPRCRRWGRRARRYAARRGHRGCWLDRWRGHRAGRCSCRRDRHPGSTRSCRRGEPCPWRWPPRSWLARWWSGPARQSSARWRAAWPAPRGSGRRSRRYRTRRRHNPPGNRRRCPAPRAWAQDPRPAPWSRGRHRWPARDGGRGAPGSRRGTTAPSPWSPWPGPVATAAAPAPVYSRTSWKDRPWSRDWGSSPAAAAWPRPCRAGTSPAPAGCHRRTRCSHTPARNGCRCRAWWGGYECSAPGGHPDCAPDPLRHWWPDRNRPPLPSRQRPPPRGAGAWVHNASAHRAGRPPGPDTVCGRLPCRAAAGGSRIVQPADGNLVRPGSRSFSFESP